MAATPPPASNQQGKYVCYPCKRKFGNAVALKRHETASDMHRKVLDRRDEKMKRRKQDLIFAVQAIRQQLAETDEALQGQMAGNETLEQQRLILEMQLRQLSMEYGQAQEIIEVTREAREARRAGIELPPTTKEVRVGSLLLNAGAASWQSNKDVQEDRYVIDIQLESADGRHLAGFAVLDGHSGTLCVDHVVERLPANLQKCLSMKKTLSEDSLVQAVHEACLLTDDDFLKKAREMEVLDGSTMILAIVYPEGPSVYRLLTACIGDSRAVLCRRTEVPGSGGNTQQLVAVPLSDDHKPNREDEQRRVEAHGGMVDFQGVWRVFTPGPAKFGGQIIARWGLAVSRAFGDLLLKEAERYDCLGVLPGGLISSVPEIRVVDLQPGVDRFLILASDGVWDVMSNEDAVETCASTKTTELAAQHLLRRTYAANSGDNITAMVVSWKLVPLPEWAAV